MADTFSMGKIVAMAVALAKASPIPATKATIDDMNDMTGDELLGLMNQISPLISALANSADMCSDQLCLLSDSIARRRNITPEDLSEGNSRNARPHFRTRYLTELKKWSAHVWTLQDECLKIRNILLKARVSSAKFENSESIGITLQFFDYWKIPFFFYYLMTLESGIFNKFIESALQAAESALQAAESRLEAAQLWLKVATLHAPKASFM